MLEFTKPLKAEIPEAQKVVEPLPEPKTHKVKKGESLWEIAEMYYGDGNRYVDIKTANELKSDILKTGKVLKIPF